MKGSAAAEISGEELGGGRAGRPSHEKSKK